MTSHRPQAELVDISTDDCWELVRARSIGRFAANRFGGCPLVVPVNYLVDGDEIVFRTGAGAKLSATGRGHVCLQLDEIDPMHHVGWSVVVDGTACWLYEEQDDAKVETWAPGDRPYVIRLTPTKVTGRRIHLTQFDTDSRGYR